MRFPVTRVILYTALLGTASIVAQTEEINRDYRPRTYDVQVRQFKIYPDTTEDIIFLGNSITARAQWNELLQLPQAKNRGISGDTTFGILERLDEVTEGQPAQIFILIGINDISRNFPDEEIIQNYETIITRIQKESPKTRLVVQTILPVNSSFGEYERHYNKDGHIAKVNEGIRQLAKKYGLTLIDIHPLFLDDSGSLKAEYTDEGLHLNEKGYLHWAEILRPYFE
ncbi:sialate O-acetylesterase [Flagellimonas taeanensis]|uniref:SGNH/GDSL hydrolase family protein n=1 Tax=Flavobacteriaceae TaxID=49546 RepID=UPI000E6A1283|nr:MULTISPECIES: SGNH/GDSL hydrolase family protein [Allomuricauda]MDC6386401.1 SGNH/GDSL hydrolase family protein [Muricauda sp. SK9]RIV51986.1 sialate O-acetylesterase [Allomuricauda taeanensis]